MAKLPCRRSMHSFNPELHHVSQDEEICRDCIPGMIADYNNICFRRPVSYKNRCHPCSDKKAGNKTRCWPILSVPCYAPEAANFIAAYHHVRAVNDSASSSDETKAAANSAWKQAGIDLRMKMRHAERPGLELGADNAAASSQEEPTLTSDKGKKHAGPSLSQYQYQATAEESSSEALERRADVLEYNMQVLNSEMHALKSEVQELRDLVLARNNPTPTPSARKRPCPDDWDHYCEQDGGSSKAG